MRVRSTEKYDGAARGEGRGDVHARSDGLEEGDRRGRDRHRRESRRPGERAVVVLRAPRPRGG